VGVLGGRALEGATPPDYSQATGVVKTVSGNRRSPSGSGSGAYGATSSSRRRSPSSRRRVHWPFGGSSRTQAGVAVFTWGEKVKVKSVHAPVRGNVLVSRTIRTGPYRGVQ
jgi:hypothetical protein